MYTSMMRRALFGSGDTATLSLDLSSGTLPTEITFTRADSTARATYIDASGYVKTVASAGAPRFDYTGGVAKGLLIEAAATNLLKYSASPDTNWIAFGGYSKSYTPGITSPANDTSAIRATFGATGNGVYTNNSSMGYTNTVGDTYTQSAWIRATTNTNNLNIRFGDSAVGFSANIPITTTWTRYSYSYEAVSNSGPTLASASIGGHTGEFEVWGLQLEKATKPSSYISTTAAALTRLADDAVIRSTAWTGLYSKPGTIVVEYYRGEYGAGDRSVLAIDTAATKHIHLKHANASAGSGVYNSAGLAVCAKLGGNVTGLNKAAFNWTGANPSNIKYALNGNAVVVSGTSDIGATLGTWMTIGSASTTGVSGSGTWEGYLNNSIKSVKYYSELLSDADMIAKTT